MSWKDPSNLMRLSNLTDKVIGKGAFTHDVIIFIIHFVHRKNLVYMYLWTERVKSPSGPHMYLCILLSLLIDKV